MAIQVENQQGNKDLVERIEALLEKPLPEDYRHRLISDALDFSEHAEFWVPHPSGAWIDSPQAVYDAETILTLVENERELVAQGYRDYPDGMLPIGDNASGDTILLSLRDTEFGTVHYMFHEEACPQDRGDEGVYRLANTFTDWFDRLHKIERQV